MVDTKIEYLDPDEHFEAVEIQLGKSEFTGNLCERVSGGFDLYFSTQVWDPMGLSVDQIVRLRKMADEHGEIFIEAFDERKMSSKLKSHATDRLKAWVRATVGM